MKFYTLTLESKKQILEDMELLDHLDRELQDCCDTEFIKVVSNLNTINN